MKILCIPYTHTLSHISRPLSVAVELRRRNHEVIFAGESHKKVFIEQEGFHVLPLYEPDPELLYGNIRSGKIRFVSNSDIEKMISADLALFAEVKPDLVLTDGRITAAISTHIAKLKHAAIVNVSSTEYRAIPYVPFFEWLPEWMAKRDGFLWETLERVNLSLEMTVFDTIMGTFNTLSKQYGTVSPVTATNCLTGKDLTLLPDIPEYFPTRNLPANYHYIGPLTWHQNLQKPSWWPPETGNRPVVYITMGTTGISDFFETIYETFKGSEFTVVMSTGGQTKNLATQSGCIYIHDYLDGDMVMELSDLVVCHGGNGTIYQALSHGKPIIGIPTIPDQNFNMRRVEALGVGRMITWDKYINHPHELLDVIAGMLSSDTCRLNAQKLQQRIHDYNSCNIAADIIERLLFHKE